MFLVAYYCFAYGMNTSLYVISDIYDKYITDREFTNPKESFHLLNFMTRRYRKFSFTSMYKCVSNFDTLIRGFCRKSLETYKQLNEISKMYRHEETGGVVCSYAMAKGFLHLDATDFIDSSKQDKYQSMIDTFTAEIRYYDKVKFDEIDALVLKNTLVTARKASDLTRYVLRRQMDKVFILKWKKVDVKSNLSSLLQRYYGTFPPPHIEMHPLTLLCEMMAGAVNDANKFAASEILQQKAFKPVLTKWSGKEYTMLILEGLNIDKPIPNHIVNAVRKHLKDPSLNTYLAYCWQLMDHVEQSGYYYHETINPFLPIYTIDADIDIYDKQYIKVYYLNQDQWAVKEALFDSLKQLFLYVCRDVMRLPVSEDNTCFFMYESMRDDLDKIEQAKFKLGIRLIVKFTTICFINRSVVNKFLKVLNVYRYKFEHLRQIQDETIFDKAIYGQLCHELRLPLNLKPNGMKALLPVFFKCHSTSFMKGLQMTSSLVHYANGYDGDAEIQYVYDVTLPTEEIIGKFDTDGVYKKMYIAKSNKEVSTNCTMYDNLKSFKFTDQQKQMLMEAINQYSLGRLKQRGNRMIWKIFSSRPLVYQGKGKFTWCSGLRFCAITPHVKASGNPCDYYVRLSPKVNERFGKHDCYIFCHCFSSSCRDRTRNNCIWKCLV